MRMLDGLNAKSTHLAGVSSRRTRSNRRGGSSNPERPGNTLLHEFDPELLDRLALTYVEAVLPTLMNDSRPHTGRNCDGKEEDMQIGKYRKSKWLKKEDVAGFDEEQRLTTIEAVLEEQVGDDIKPVIYFKGIEKGWVANMTGLEVLAEMSGSQDTEDFIGLRIEIYVDPDVRYGGKRVGGIKLRPAPLKRAPKGSDIEFDDSIPY